MSTIRSLHLRGAIGTVRREQWNGREHLVVPVVALQEAVIHAVNAKTAEYVPLAPLTASQSKWNGHPLVVGHPVKDGKQISAHSPEVLARHGFGFIRQAAMTGARLGMEAMVDPARLRELRQDKLLADLEAGTPIEVSVGAFVNTKDGKGSFEGRAYDGEWTEITPDHLAFLPSGVGACSLAMGCGAHHSAMLVTAEGFEEVKEPKVDKIPKSMSEVKKRILAFFDSPEMAASEEAAELIAYNAMRTQFDAVGDKWDAVSGLIDELIADEEEDPTVTRQQEDAEEEVEDARLDAIRMHCYSMIAELQAVCNACIEQQMPDIQPADPRYMETFKTLVGKEISAKNAKVIQAAHDSSHDVHTQTVALGAQCSGMKALAGMKDCPDCNGTGQKKDGDKQADCPTCAGEGRLKTAEFKAACSCEEADVKKEQRIAALLANEHNPVKDLTDKTSDEVLTVLEAQAESNKKHAAELKAAQDKQAETEKQLKAAQAAQIPAEELSALRALSAEKTAKDVTEKATLVTRLEPLKTLSKEQLEAKTLDELRTLARFAKVDVVDYSVRGIPVPRAAEAADDFTPPNSYEPGIKALQAKGAVN